MNASIFINGTPAPDARLDLFARRKRTEVVLGGSRVYERVFCINCGKATGGVPQGTPAVFFLCDDCVGKWGPPPGCVEVKIDGHH